MENMRFKDRFCSLVLFYALSITRTDCFTFYALNRLTKVESRGIKLMMSKLLPPSCTTSLTFIPLLCLSLFDEASFKRNNKWADHFTPGGPLHTLWSWSWLGCLFHLIIFVSVKVLLWDGNNGDWSFNSSWQTLVARLFLFGVKFTVI